MTPSSMNDLFNFVYQLLTQHSNTFETLGLNLFRGLAVILIVWFGVRSALSAAGGRHGFQFDQFANLILSIAFCYAMIVYYSRPIPGIGSSFHSLIADQGLSLANTLNNNMTEEVFQSSRYRVLLSRNARAGVQHRPDRLLRHPSVGVAHSRGCHLLRHFLRLYRRRRGGALGTGVHPVFHRPQDGVVVLGMVQGI